MREYKEYQVKIHPKSSPEGLLAGNDTACCMPFGSGKNNVYMYNLGCAIMTVAQKMGNNNYRTIAQSVITPDIDIGTNISSLQSRISENQVLSELILKDLSKKEKIILTADNIEVSPNANHLMSDIEKVYKDFFGEYLSQIENTDIEKEYMLIGKGYSDLHFKEVKVIDNTFIPIIPVAYSDNYAWQRFGWRGPRCFRKRPTTFPRWWR